MVSRKPSNGFYSRTAVSCVAATSSCPVGLPPLNAEPRLVNRTADRIHLACAHLFWASVLSVTLAWFDGTSIWTSRSFHCPVLCPMTGGVGQIDWPELIRPHVDADFDRVAIKLSARGDRADVLAVVSILEVQRLPGHGMAVTFPCLPFPCSAGRRGLALTFLADSPAPVGRLPTSRHSWFG